MQLAFRSLSLAAAFIAAVGNVGSAQSDVQIPPSSIVRASLIKAIDAKKNNVGDEVSAKVTSDLKVQGVVLIRKNSIIVGRLTDVRAKSKDQDVSVVAINFERVVFKEGDERPLTVVIQALSKPPNDPNGNMNEILRGAGFNQTANAEATKAAAMGGIGSAPQILTASSQGAMGYPGVGLQHSMVYSASTSIHLDEGTLMILQVSAKNNVAPSH